MSHKKAQHPAKTPTRETPMTSILIVDDEQSMRDFLTILLQKEGYQVETRGDGESALHCLEDNSFDLVISDIRMPGIGGLDLLHSIKGKHPTLPVILITAFVSPADAVAAMKDGAFDYISKPFKVEEIKNCIRSATARKISDTPVQSPADAFPDFIGNSPEMVRIFDLIQRVAPTSANVIIYGESGTGKELVAQAIHRHSNVADQPFVPITCSAIPEDLMESELFGHVKGSFTGAIGDKPGLFQLANNGTAFLDEIGELTPIIQTKLLRVLQEREVKPVGSTRIEQVNVRIIAATNRVLEDEIIAGRFREDLFYRLTVVPIRMPPLRERKGDVPLLVNHFLKKHSRLLGKKVQEISSYGMQVLMNYNFPGNVRELENIIERGIALENSNIILPENLTLSSYRLDRRKKSENDPMFQAVANKEELFEQGLEEVINDLEKRIITFALERCNNSRMRAAELLRISFRSLRYKIKKYAIEDL
jgi:two-component system response regulator PilR (NtrC family)